MLPKRTGAGREVTSRRRFLKTAGIGTATFTLAGCSKSGSSSDDGQRGDVSGDALSSETVKIGVLTLLPEQEPIGRSMADSARLAVDHLNEGGGFLPPELQGNGILGADVELLIGDTQATPGPALKEHRRLAFKENVDLTIGVYLDNVLANLMDSIAEHQTLHFTTGATGPQFAKLVKNNYEKYKYHFRPGPTNSNQLSTSIEEFLRLYADQLGWDRVAFLFEDFDQIENFYERLQGNVEQYFDEVVMYRYTSQTTTNWNPIYDEVERKNADLAFVFQSISGVSAVTQWANQKRQFEFGGLHVLSQFNGFWEETDGNTEYVFTGTTVTPQTKNSPLTQPYMDAYHKQFDEYPIYSGPLTYQGIHIYAEAVRQAGTTNPAELIPVLEELVFEPSIVSQTPAEFQGPNARYPHDPVYTCMSDCKNPTGVPVWQQWQEGDDGGGVQEAFAPEMNKTADYQRPHWLK